MKMTDTGKEIEINLASQLELASALIDQLGIAFAELKAHKVTQSDNVQWDDIESYFRDLESVIKKKLKDLEAKEKEFSERESHNNLLLAEREAAVVAKERDVMDKVQELKDVAVAAISAARTSYAPDILEPVNDSLTNVNKVSSSIDDENTEPDTQEGDSPRSVEENADDVAVEVNPREELIQLCEKMDSRGVVNFVMENVKNPSRVCKEISVALGSATEPACLVLNALEGFFPPNEMSEGGKDDASLHGMRRSCLILMEALSAFFTKVDTALDTFLTPDAKSQAKSIANEWKLKLDGESIDATNEMPLVAEGFLRLLATFRIASEFNEDDLCKQVLAVSDHRQATELCRCLQLSLKVPGLVEKLLKNGRPIDAVHFIHAFQLSGALPSVPILKTYLKDIRRNSQGNGSAGLQVDYNARELEALRNVISCVEDYKLEAEYPLHQLYIRVSQLDKSVKVPGKRAGESSKQPTHPHQLKRPRPDGRFQVQRGRASGRGSGGDRMGRGRGRGQTGTYTGIPQRYTTPAPPTTYTYPVATQSAYGAQANDSRMYYYGQNDQARTSYSAAAPTYGTYQQPSYPSHQPYM